MYKDILVHLDGGDRDALRIGLGLGLAQRFGGRLTGLFARSEKLAPAAVARRASPAFDQAAKLSEEQFHQAAATARVPVRWWRLAHGENGHVLHEVLVCSRFHDLTILGQHHDAKECPEELAEHVILQSGRPVLILPSVGSFPTLATNVLMAWNGGREAARALHDAMPLITGAERVEILTVRDQPGKPMAADQVPPLSIIDH
ncbi:MAG TPA: universal stress protein, partial [Magnetospirillum sp.]|nr:universal stress protein [Magnetospirillum sp.]